MKTHVTAPYETDQYPDRKIKDRGCGGPKTDHTRGADVKTDVVIRQTN